MCALFDSLGIFLLCFPSGYCFVFLFEGTVLGFCYYEKELMIGCVGRGRGSGRTWGNECDQNTFKFKNCFR